MYWNLRYEGNGGLSPTGFYWSSTESSNNVYAWGMRFSDGVQETSEKENNNRARPVRAF